MKIKKVSAREILDSRGVPTVEALVVLEDGSSGKGAVPSGASTGVREAYELRDNDETRYFGMGTTKAIANVNTDISGATVGHEFNSQADFDQTLIDLDGTENKQRLGANAILSVSMAFCKASSQSKHLPLYQYFQEITGLPEISVPQLAILIMEGGKHGDWATDFQEYMVIPRKEKFPSVSDSLRAGAEIFKATHDVLIQKNYSATVGYEGAYAPREIKSNAEAFDIILEGIDKAGYKIADDILLGIDPAASEFYKDGIYSLRREGKELHGDDYLKWVTDLTQKYPVWSLEDMYAEDDWDGWISLTKKLGENHQIVGDDLLTTNVQYIQKAIELNACNSVLIKINQIGTITETLEAIRLAHSAGFTTMISHRSGETNDDLIADLVMGTTSWQTKFGGPDRGERLAKYNRLLEIEEELKA